MDHDPAPSPRLARHALVLRRSTDELQIGLDPSVVVPASYERFVRALARDEASDLVRALAEQDGVSPGAFSELVDALGRARLLRPAGVERPTVRLVGAGALGVRTAYELVAAGVGTIYLADLPDHQGGSDQASRGEVRRRRHRAGASRIDQLVATLSRVDGTVRVRRSQHFLKPEGASVALTVVASDGPEPDRIVTDLLRDHDAAHLLIRTQGNEATVGPLVVPGATSCVRCGDLVRRDADPSWPQLLDQLTRLSVVPTPTLLAWAAVTATVQAFAFAAGAVPETLGHTLELRSDDHTTRLRPWPRHPECACRWDAATREPSNAPAPLP